ncbi:MAG: RluA family pseudouridine synthase, partial [Ruminococcaceae bacterium]|nr:RluA family pseudouridine synthase [Oscillospiraceae bacterium]
MREFIINQNDSEQRLDKFLLKACRALPVSMLCKAVRNKDIKVNGKRTQINYRLQENDVVRVYLNDSFFEEDTRDFTCVTPDIDIIYEDSNIILVNKKSGMLCHEDEKEKVNTLINHICAYLYKKGEFNPKDENSFTPALCNRIDRNTSGIVIAAKNAVSLRILNEKIKNRELTKKYLCLAVGSFEKKSGTLTDYLVKNQDQNRVYLSKTYEQGSKTAVLKYWVKDEKNGLSLLEIDLITGRTHQIRAHFANRGH